MNFIPIDIDVQNFFLTFGTIVSFYAIYKTYYQRQQYKEEIKFIESAQIKEDVFEVVDSEIVGKDKRKKKYLSKAKIQNFPITIYYPIRCNELNFVEPSSIPILRQFIQIYNWNSPTSQNLSQIKRKKQISVGRIAQENLFKVEHKYYSFDQLVKMSQKNEKLIKNTIGFWESIQQSQLAQNPNNINKMMIQQYKKRQALAHQFSKSQKNAHIKGFLYYLSSYAQSLFSFFKEDFYKLSQRNFTHEYRRPLFKGVLTGILQHKFTLLKNTNFLVKFTIEDGIYTPQLIASSKQKIVQFYLNRISSLNFQLGFCIGAFILFGSVLTHSMKKNIKVMSLKLGLRGQKFLNPSQVSDDKLCQICYVNCRNLIFMDCKHLVMCIQCYEHHKQTKCMICTKQIKDVKTIFDYKQKDHHHDQIRETHQMLAQQERE